VKPQQNSGKQNNSIPQNIEIES
ncbi:hypothetical protein ACFMKD_30385, partial [Acinetobacter baumannii]